MQNRIKSIEEKLARANPDCTLCKGKGSVTIYCTSQPNFDVWCVKCFPEHLPKLDE